jgi:hypothetical protein
MNTLPRKSLAIAAVLLLSVPSAVGVQRALAPTRGDIPAWLAALGFELVYLSVALLILRPELRRYAQRIALGAVVTAVSLNSIADYAARVPGGLATWPQARALFDPLALALAIGESLPLAVLAYALATLLHRLGEDTAIAPIEAPNAPAIAPIEVPTVAYAREAMPPPVVAHNALPNGHNATIATTPIVAAHCPHCSAVLPSPAHLGAAKRWGYCKECKPPTN